MTQFQVDSEAVLATTAAVRGSMARIQGEVGSLLTQLVNLQGSWTGQASLAFQTVVSDWRATQARVEENLGTINHALTLAAHQYVEIETSNARLFQH